MFTTKKKIYLFDVNSRQNPLTGDREKEVANAQIVIGDVDLVGVQTQQLGQAQGQTFAYSVEIDRMYYARQRYIYFDDALYEVGGQSKGVKAYTMKLKVKENDDADLKKVIREWIQNV